MSLVFFDSATSYTYPWYPRGRGGERETGRSRQEVSMRLLVEFTRALVVDLKDERERDRERDDQRGGQVTILEITLGEPNHIPITATVQIRSQFESSSSEPNL
jgi:hypothetical protein